MRNDVRENYHPRSTAATTWPSSLTGAAVVMFRMIMVVMVRMIMIMIMMVMMMVRLAVMMMIMQMRLALRPARVFAEHQ
jgi:hypothetical protein